MASLPVSVVIISANSAETIQALPGVALDSERKMGFSELGLCGATSPSHFRGTGGRARSKDAAARAAVSLGDW